MDHEESKSKFITPELTTRALDKRVPTYQYQPLSSNSHIRVLVLEPGQRHSPLKGRLETFDLIAEECPFDAISYVWGSNVKDHTIAIDGGALLPITASLDAAFRQTRLEDEIRTVWADAICINQADYIEKGFQVALMGKVYQTSRRTLICLSTTDPQDKSHAHNLTTLIRDVDEMMDEVFKDARFSWDWDSFPWPQPDDPLLDDPRWNSWMCLIQNPWFERGWVVQEAILGPDAVVFWAGEIMPFLTLLRTRAWFNERGQIHSSLKLHPLPRIFMRLYALRLPNEYHTFWPPSDADRTDLLTTLDTLHRARILKLTEPKDRIYAFMAIPTSDKVMAKLHLSPDYSENTSHMDLYQDFAVKYLEETSNLDLLSFVEHDNGLDHGQDSRSLPSWAPRWDHGEGVEQMWFPPDSKVFGKDNMQDFAIVPGSSPKLQVSGSVMDSIVRTSPILENDREASASVAVERVLAVWRDIAADLAKYAGPHRDRSSLNFLQALCQTYYVGEWASWVEPLKACAQLLQSDIAMEAERSTAVTEDTNAQMVAHVTSISHNRRFVVLGRGYYGTAPSTALEGDVVAIIYGTRSPCILRKVAGEGESDDKYQVVGSVILLSKTVDAASGIPQRMRKTEGCDDWEGWDLPTQTFTLC